MDPNQIYTHQTWERFAKGRTLVGVDEDDTTFSAVNKTGGSKTVTLTVDQIPSHEGHTYSNGTTAWGGNTARYLNSSVLTAYGSSARGWSLINGNEIVPAALSRGGGKSHNNLQPYETVYYWKRVA